MIESSRLVEPREEGRPSAVCNSDQSAQMAGGLIFQKSPRGYFSMVGKIPEGCVGPVCSSAVGRHKVVQKIKIDTLLRAFAWEDLRGAPSAPHIHFWRDESEFVHVRTP